MANYQSIKGFNIQSKSSDPVPFAQEKINNPWAGVWSSGGSLNVAKSQIAGFGTISAAGAAMGKDAPGTLLATYEVYNGTSWTESTDINTAGRNGRGAGTTTAALVFGGWPRAGATETWNGSAWTEVNEMTRGATASQSQAAFGTNTAALAAGGEPGTGGFQLVETWNGTSWTEVNELNTGRQGPVGFGITTAGFVISGYSPPAPPGNVITNVESWNGSAWTETTDINTARGQGGASGNTTAGLIYGGDAPPGRVAATESWNGSAWTEVNDLATAKSQFGFNSNPSTGSTDALAMGGETAPIVATVEEWTFAGIPPSAPAVGYSDSIVGDMYYNSTSGQFKAIKDGGAPIGTWASGGSLNTARFGLGGAGIQTAALAFAGGLPSPYTAKTESYNGSSWTEVNDLNTPRYLSAKQSAGTVNTAALCISGYANPPGANTPVVESWNGSNWTETGDVNTARRGAAAGGTQTSAILSGGYTTTYAANAESWNGTSWTEVGDLNTAREDTGGAGASNSSAITAGGYTGTQSANAEIFNGTSWTEVNDLNTARSGRAGSGIVTSALAIGGEPGGIANVEFFNGSSWSEINDLSTARGKLASSATGTTTSLAIGGNAPPSTAAVEEFTAADFQIKTVTTS